MIGANSSPMSMFGGGGDAFQRGMVIGNANSPFSSVAEALKNTVDKYNSHLSMQQEQQNKLEQIKATGVADHPWLFDAQGNRNPTAAPNANNALNAGGPQIMLDPTTKKYFYANQSFDPTMGMTKESWAPVSPNAPEDQKKVFENSMYGMLNGQNPGAAPQVGTPPVSTQPAAQTDTSNIIQQSATGATTSPVEQDAVKAQQAIKILTDNKKPLTPANIKHVMSQL